MQQPETPTKRLAADKLFKTIDHLSAQWGLPLPRRNASNSPSKIQREDSVEEQIVARLKFLSFKNEAALDSALEAFEQNAALICQGWKFKPNADHDVLPRRNSASLASGSFIRRSVTDPLIVAELLESLLDLVKQAAEQVKRDLEQVTNTDGSFKLALSTSFPAPSSRTMFTFPPLPTNSGSRSFSDARSAQSEQPQCKKRNLPYRNSKEAMRGHDNSVEDAHLSSSAGFNPDHDTLDIMENINMTDASDWPAAQLPAPTREKFKLSDDEDFITPPTSPSVFEKSTECLIDPRLKGEIENENDRSGFYVQQSGLIRLPKLASKKRPFPEAMKPPFPRKASRGENRVQPPTTYGVNSLKPTDQIYKLDDPFRDMDDTDSASRLMTTPGLSRTSTSFDSISTATTTTTASSIAWSARRSYASGSTLTTPNTSFRSDSLMASFSSNNDSFYNSEVVVSSAVPENNTTIRSAPNTPRAKRRAGPLQRAATAPNAEAPDDDADPMDIDRRQEVLSELLETPKAKNKTLSIGSNSDWLPNLLRSLPLMPSIDVVVPSKIPLRQLYEVTRVALFGKLPVSTFSRCLSEKIDEYEKLWSSMAAVVKTQNASLPEKCSKRAWENAQKSFNDVHLAGDWKFPDREQNSIFQFSLKPLQVAVSYRLARKFGSDRFCIVGMPGLERLPPYLRIDPAIMRARIVDLLSHTDVSFLGRRWRAFYLKSDSAKKTRFPSTLSFNDIKYRVYFFARDGDHFEREGLGSEQDGGNHHRSKMEIDEMLNWFMPFKNNLNQPCLKFFARLALGVSTTTPTVQFESFEIVTTSDARADAPAVRRLSLQNLEERTEESKSRIMNDGCARISKAAASAIAAILGLTQVPCVFQGRIGGAKGVWMVDALDEVWPKSSRNFWIEITESQLKFQKHQHDAIYPDPARVTFEVHSYCKPLSSASLNFQLMPILAHQGVPKGEFQRLLQEDINAKVDQLDTATDSPLSLRKWNQDNNLGSETIKQESIQTQAGLPSLNVERINWFIDHGFEPGSCYFLQDLVFKAIKEYCFRIENRMNIGIGKSTYAFMIADPLAVLEENEIHLGFSNVFRDPKDGWGQVLLHEMDVLVARLPAHLPSDIQKVRAVFKPELQIYRDVIVFSSKGNCPLADKLSGGDYDGDRAWICWEPALVSPFKNSLVPKVPSLQSYGIQKVTTKVADVMEEPDYIKKFLRHAFHFNIQASMLGFCTTYHESLCYSGISIDDPKAIAIAALLGHLVDRAKTGIIFNESDWLSFLKRNDLPLRMNKPAYKDKERARMTPHMIDQLVFVTAKGIREKALQGFSAKFADVGTWDEDLARLWSSEIVLAKNDQSLNRGLTDLKAALDPIVTFWGANARVEDGDEGRTLRKPRNQISFAALVEKCRDDFLSIAPTFPSETNPSSTLGRWSRECSKGQSGYWSLIKASCLFHKCHKSRLIWYAAGIELGEIKAMAQGRGTYRVTVQGIYSAMKLDRKFLERARRKELECHEANDFVDEDDEYGDWGLDE